MRRVESVDTDGGSVNWAYDTPMSAPRRGLQPPPEVTGFAIDTELEVLDEIELPIEFEGAEGAPFHDGTISPLINTRRDTPESTPVAAARWETLGLGVLLLGGSALALALALSLAAGLLAFI